MNLTKWAHGISWGLHPFMLPLYMVGVMLSFTELGAAPLAERLYALGLILLFAFLLPVVMLVVLRRCGAISDFKIDNRRERFLPLLAGTLCYLLCGWAFLREPTPAMALMSRFMFAAAACEVMCFAVSLFWKISLHLTGMGAVTGMLWVVSRVWELPMTLPLCVALAGAVLLGAARYYLHCHTLAQLLAGFCGGCFWVLLIA